MPKKVVSHETGFAMLSDLVPADSSGDVIIMQAVGQIAMPETVSLSLKYSTTQPADDGKIHCEYAATMSEATHRRSLAHQTNSNDHVSSL